MLEKYKSKINFIGHTRNTLKNITKTCFQCCLDELKKMKKINVFRHFDWATKNRKRLNGIETNLKFPSKSSSMYITSLSLLPVDFSRSYTDQETKQYCNMPANQNRTN